MKKNRTDTCECNKQKSEPVFVVIIFWGMAAIVLCLALEWVRESAVDALGQAALARAGYATQFLIGLLAILGIGGWLWSSVLHHPERVIVTDDQGKQWHADVVGASQLQADRWHRVKIRFYDDSGNGLWASGDGFERQEVHRWKYGYLIRVVRKLS